MHVSALKHPTPKTKNGIKMNGLHTCQEKNEDVCLLVILPLQLKLRHSRQPNRRALQGRKLAGDSHSLVSPSLNILQ